MVSANASPPSHSAPGRKTLTALGMIRMQTAFHEKAVQFTFIGLALTLAAANASAAWLNFDLIAFAIPPLSVLFLQPPAQRLAARLPNGLALQAAVALQTLAFAAAAGFLLHQQFLPAAACFLLFAVQFALLEPVHAGLARAFAPECALHRFHRSLRLLVPAAIVLGTFLTGELFVFLTGRHGAWTGATWILAGLFAISLGQILLASLVRSASAATPSPALPPARDGRATLLRRLFRHRDLRLAALGVAFFWFAATLTGAILLLAAREHSGPGPAALALATRLTGAAGFGVILGCLSVSLYCRRGLELDLVPAAALGLAASFLCAVFSPAGSASFYAAMIFLGLSGGLFFVSLHAFLQQKAGSSHEQSVLPAVQCMAALAQILALGLEWLLRAIDLPSSLHFAILGILSAGAVAFIARILPRHFLRFFVSVLTRMIYRVHRLHPEHVPREGGVLMISNHVSYVDAFLLSVACPRPVRFVIIDHFLEVPAFGWFLRLFDVIPISPTRAKDAIRTTAEALKQGDLVCIFPEGQLTRTGMLNELKKGFELIVRQARCPVLPVYMDSVWGSIFSFERFRYFSKLPRRLPYPVTVHFGLPVAPGEIDSARARSLIQDLSVEAFALREDLCASLGAAAIRGLRQHGTVDLFVDLGQNLRRLNHREALHNSLALAALWRERLPANHRRLGILLPPGAMPALLHLAAVLAGRVPVHLPLSFLHDASARERFLAKHEIHTVFSSRTLFPEPSLPPGWIDLREAISAVGFARKLLARLSQRLLPPSLSIRRLGLHQIDRDAEAVAYADELTGQLVSLSHRNLLATVHQIDSTLLILPGDRILIDASFCSIQTLALGLWYPCLNRNTALFRSLSARKIDPAFLLQDQKPQVVLLSQELTTQLLSSTGPLPPSIRIFLSFSPAAPEQIVRLESAGAACCTGYAPPGFGAIVSVNTTDPNSMIPHHLPQTGNQPGTAGRLMPGLSARLVSAEGAALEPAEDVEGVLAVRGASIPGNPGFLIEGIPHHRLDVLAQFDRQGFLTLRSQPGIRF